MINFSFITKILSIKSLKDLLLSRVMEAFNESFNRTNENFGFKSKPNPAVLDYLKQREFILSEKTMSALHGNLQFELLEGINAKESITDLKIRLNKIFDLEDWKIERIARTESINAFQSGEFHSQLQSGVAQWKQWKAHFDKRTGSDSKRMDGQIVKINEEFEDYKTGNTCMHPPLRPNDRCTCLYLYKLPKTIKKYGMLYKE